MKFKLPDGFENRDDALESLVRHEAEVEGATIAFLREMTLKFLSDDKGYLPEDIKTDQKFDVSIGGDTAVSSVDIVISINGKRMISIICFADSLASRQRHAVACARLLDTAQVPFAVITDGENALVLDTVTGKETAEGLCAIPSRAELVTMSGTIEPRELPADKVEKEKRIVQAYDAIRCTKSDEGMK